jgi:hypothetical protein
MATLLMGLEKVMYVMSRCRIYEKLYIVESAPSPAVDNLISALIATYSVILAFLSKAAKVYNQNTPTRAIVSLWSKDETTEFGSKCESLERRLDSEAQNCEACATRYAESKTSRQIDELKGLLLLLTELRDLTGPIIRTENTVSLLWQASEQLERGKILEWVSDIRVQDHHQSARDRRTPDTGNWIFETSQFQEWIDEENSTLLWLHGIRKLLIPSSLSIQLTIFIFKLARVKQSLSLVSLTSL